MIGNRVVAWDRYKDVVLDEPAVVAKHGVHPASIPDLLGLVGDTADGIPGLPGWGKSSAAKVLTVWKHIQHIPDDPAQWNVPGLRGVDRLALSLRENREVARSCAISMRSPGAASSASHSLRCAPKSVCLPIRCA